MERGSRNVPAAFREIQEFTMETEVPDMHTDTKLNTEVKVKGKRKAPHLLYMDVQKVIFLNIFITLKK